MIKKVAPLYQVRTMTVDDLETVLSWRNHPDIRCFMFTQHEISLQEHSRWFAHASQDSRKHLLVFEVNDIPQGFVNINEQGGGVADWGFYVAPDAPKGTGFQLGCSAISYAFYKIGLHKLCGQALAYNERSIQFHFRMGFHQEGILRDQHYDGNNYHAVVCFGLLEHEWQRMNVSTDHD